MYTSLVKRGIAGVVLFALLTNSAFATTFTVNNNGDASDASHGDGSCATAGAVCTLRAAIEETNDLAGTHTIGFNAGLAAITPGSAYEQLSRAGLTIDGAAGTSIDGSSAGASVNGLTVGTTDVTIKDLYIYKFGGSGIRIASGAKDVLITGNVIGTNVAGATDKQNTLDGIRIDISGAENVSGSNGGVEGIYIGGSTVAEANILSGNTQSGISNSSTGNISGTVTLHGNIIGLGTDGTTALGNDAVGVYSSASANLDWVITGNVISANGGSGVDITTGDEVTLTDNIIGLDATGGPDGNVQNGVAVDARVVRIGSDLNGSGDSDEGNTISKNSGGINLTGTEYSNITIYGNNIGVASNGSGAYGNTNDGIYINDDSSTATTVNIGAVGVTNVSDGGNVISNNSGLGINVLDVGSGSTVTVQNNIIGYDVNGTTSRGNTDYGAQFLGSAGRLYTLLFGTDGNGTSDSSEGNMVGNNGAYGVYLTAPGMTSFTVAGNSIKAHSNRELGIGALTGLTGNTSTIGGDLDAERNVFGSGVDGIVFNGNLNAKTVTVRNNYVGIDTNGTTDIGGSSDGIQIESITDGSTLTIQSNVISGNTGEGVKIESSVTSAVINIIGNMIGTNAAGTSAVANNSGIDHWANTTINIGDGTASGKNIISGNTISGVHIRNGIANILGNYIGTNMSGTGAVQNGSIGIQVGNTAGTANIGNGTTGGRNIISGNNGPGIETISGTINVLGNYIGVDVTGLVALPNVFGVHVGLGPSTVGDGTAGGRNIISGNTGAGILGDGTFISTIKGNYIGTDVNGTAAVPNGSSQVGGGFGDRLNYGGVWIRDKNVTLGGDRSIGEGNVISGNYGQGVFVLSGISFTASGNYIGVDATGLTAMPNSAGSGTYQLLQNGDTGLEGSGIIVGDFATGISNTVIGGTNSNYGNVIAGNAGFGVAVIGDSGGAGLNWTNGYIKNNLLGYLTNGTKLANGSNEIYVNKNSGTITGLSIGGSGGENTINNDSHVGIKLVDITDSNLASGSLLTHLKPNNLWTNIACPIVYNYSYWQQFTGGTVTNQELLSTFCGSERGGASSGDVGVGSNNDNSQDTQPTETPDDTDTSEETTEDSDNTEVAETSEATTEPATTTTETEETVQPVEMVDVVVTESEASDALQGVVNTFYNYFPTEDDEEEIPTVNDLEELLAQAETETTTTTETVATTVEQQQIEEFLQSGGVQNAEEVQTIITTTFSESVKKAIDGGGVFAYPLKKDNEIDEATTFEFEGDYLRALKRQTEAKKNGENVFVITPSTDLDKDGVADVLQIAENGKLFEEGKVTANEKIFFGASLARSYKRLEDILPGVPTITNIPKEGAIVGKEIELWIANAKKGEKLDIFLVDPETEEEFHAAKTETDKRYRGAYTLKFEEVLEKEITENTEYYIVVQNKRGQGSLTKVTVDPDLEMEVVSVRLTGGRQTFNETLYSTVLLAAGGEKQENAMLSGYAEPGSKVYVTWRSLVMSSVVVADASQGYFEVEAPEDLEEGDHEAIVYVFRDRQKLVGNITSLLFRK